MGPEVSTRSPQATWGTAKTVSMDPGRILLHPYFTPRSLKGHTAPSVWPQALLPMSTPLASKAEAARMSETSLHPRLLLTPARKPMGPEGEGPLKRQAQSAMTLESCCLPA